MHGSLTHAPLQRTAGGALHHSRVGGVEVRGAPVCTLLVHNQLRQGLHGRRAGTPSACRRGVAAVKLLCSAAATDCATAMAWLSCACAMHMPDQASAGALLHAQGAPALAEGVSELRALLRQRAAPAAPRCRGARRRKAACATSAAAPGKGSRTSAAPWTAHATGGRRAPAAQQGCVCKC